MNVLTLRAKCTLRIGYICTTKGRAVKLTEFALNKKGVIIEILENPVSTKLVEFGIFPGVSFYIVNKASFNGPIFIQVGANRIALRRTEAAAILVE